MAFKGELYGFQGPAVKRMLDRRQLLVAFEMGLGKTVIVLAACEELLDDGKIRTAIVVCPASLKYQWRRMIERFTDDATVVLVEGSPAMRQCQYSAIVTEEPDYVILNYEQVVNDWSFVSKLPMDCIVADEVQAAKSFRSKRSRRLKRLRSTYRFGLTGQPVENRPEEVFSIMQWVDPDVLGRFEIFDRTFIKRNSYGGVLLYKNLPTLHRRLGEAMVRKRRDDPEVRDQLPKVTEDIIPVPFDTKGALLYRLIVEDLLAELTAARAMHGNFSVFRHYSATAGIDPAAMAAQGRIMSKLTCLRMLCDHPDLLRWSASNYDAGQGSGSQYAAELKAEGLLDSLGPAPKFDATMAHLEEVTAAGHKAALFSFFKESLRKIRDGAGHLRPVLFTGELTPRERDQAKQTFADDPGCRLFLSSDAGGIGLDLPEASYLCVESTMPVLTDRLTWEPAGSLVQGDGILGCQEDYRPGRGYGRRWQRGAVLHNLTQWRECVRVHLSNGDTLVVTPEHPLLVRTGKGLRCWREARSLRPGWAVGRYLNLWKTAHTFEDGWLSGLLDGEGCVAASGHGLMTQVTQNPGPVLDRARRLILLAGFSLREWSSEEKLVRHLIIGGGKAEQMRFLGTFQPMRLIKRWGELVERHTIRALEDPVVTAVEQAGQREVSVLETTTRTYVGAGYMHHNCNYNLPWSAGKFDQRQARIIRLSSEWESVTLTSVLMAGSIEERMYAMLMAKRAVADAVVDGRGIDNRGRLKLDLNTLTDFLTSSGV